MSTDTFDMSGTVIDAEYTHVPAPQATPQASQASQPPAVLTAAHLGPITPQAIREAADILRRDNSNVVQLRSNAAPRAVRKLQVKAAVTGDEKARFERLAVAIDIPLSVLIRTQLEQLCRDEGID